MNIDLFFSKFFDGDNQKSEVIELDDDLVIVGTNQFMRIQPFLGLISFINPNHRLILKRMDLSKVEINNPAINLELNTFISINRLNISKVKVRCLIFVNCNLMPPDFTITYDNIVINNSELLGLMNFKANTITFINNVIVRGTINISSSCFRAFCPIQIFDVDTETCFIKGCLNITS